IGGTVTGLAGSGLKLRNGSETLDIGGNGTFQFAGTLASGAKYNVVVAANPSSPTQSCGVTNGVGTVGSSNVTNIAVNCMTDRFTIGGTISGLAGSGLELRLNNERPFEVGAGAGDFTLPTFLPSGASYVVRVTHNPSNPAQRCDVSPNTEAGIVGSANVTSVAITCTTSAFSIGGSVSGLAGDGLVLQKNGSDDIAIASDGRFTFQTEQASGTNYQVTVRTQPTDPSQTCTVADGSGKVGSGDVSSVKVRCDINTFAIGGMVTGLLGSGLVLTNGGDDLPINADGSFTFRRDVASGSDFNVMVKTQPSNPTQACTVGNGGGTVGAGDVTSVIVNCSTSNFTVGGTVGGLAGSGLVLQNNNGDDLQVLSDGSFAFQTTVPSGAPYSVIVAVQPTGPAQMCTVTNGSGLVGGDNVTSIQVSCVTTEFSVGGTVIGLTGTGLQLQNNGADTLAIAANGPFTFPTSLPNGSPYNVTVAQQPSLPAQICAVTSSVGVVNGADVTTVQVGCIDAPL
ncbi:MAG TPA: hypothetical protein VJQ52_13945, partial [Steroidobacteraceae bacterium]|nr:hypothetical protein [Steroidobacteraceae bacterium]